MPSAKLVCWNLNGIRAVEKKGSPRIVYRFEVSMKCQKIRFDILLRPHDGQRSHGLASTQCLSAQFAPAPAPSARRGTLYTCFWLMPRSPFENS